MRKLATVRKIDSIRPIPGADSIEVAQVGGWNVVVKKNEFKENDIAIYFEIDSWIPTHIAPFLSKGAEPREYNGVKGERLRTVKLRGQLSQGLLLSTGQIVHLLMHDGWVKKNDKPSKWEDNIGEDLTEVLGIQKWEAPIPAELHGQVEGPFPSFIPKTDQERCQNLVKEIFIDNIDSKYEVTLKLDGTSFTAYVKDGVVGVCGRNWEFKINEENSGNSLIKVLKESGLGTFLEGSANIAIQGELMGPGIQNNRENLLRHKLFVFDMYMIDEGRYATPDERHLIMNTLWSAGVKSELVDHVPVISYGSTLENIGVTDIVSLLAYADGPSISHKIREGLVFKRLDGKFSFKSVNDKFLLKEE